MNLENTVKSPGAWQKLLCQAFKDTRITTSKNGTCKLYHVRHFVYQSLHYSGIENRSPFSLLQLIRISINSKGNPQHVRKLCIDSVLHMQKPSFCLLSSNYYLLLASVVLSLFTLLTPITATTFKSQPVTQSILKIKTIPWGDIESEIISLPLNSDYLVAATPFELSKEEKQLAALNASSWILDQQSSAYSLQLLSVSNKSNLIKFCNQHDICDKSAFYTTRVNGKKMVKLIYGSYPNHQAAKLAKVKLSATLKDVSPWARSFKQIKNEL